MNINSPRKLSLRFSQLLLPLSLLLSLVISCSTDSMNEEEIDIALDMEEDEVIEEVSDSEEQQPCSNVSGFVFNEKDGLVTVEFEDAKFSGDWKLKSDGSNFSGEGYMLWEGSQNLANPGVGTTSFKIKIENSGTFQFIWKSAVKTGNNSADHNDTWLRFNDADDFYAKKGTSVVYPKDTGKTPNPAGASKDGWFKIYRSGKNLDFKWQSSTFDNNPHDIFVVFESPGLYTMEISARSSGHGIDKFVLFNDAFTKTEAIADSNAKSKITCN